MKSKKVARHAAYFAIGVGAVSVVMVLLNLVFVAIRRGGMRSIAKGDLGGSSWMEFADTLGTVVNSLAMLALLVWNVYIVHQTWKRAASGKGGRLDAAPAQRVE
jgi:protein-S-isoprenylcysteine O-methyltransferase Ste14